MNFSESKIKFDGKYSTNLHLAKSLTTVDGKFVENIMLTNIIYN
jgi:hypothetical protein